MRCDTLESKTRVFGADSACSDEKSISNEKIGDVGRETELMHNDSSARIRLMILRLLDPFGNSTRNDGKSMWRI